MGSAIKPNDIAIPRVSSARGVARAIDRRSFLIGSTALAAAPALGAVPASGAVDVAIVGAGAAGIAAARRLAAAGKSFALVEASDHIGGRCITDMQSFGVPFDRGAHWIAVSSMDPDAMIGAMSELDVYEAPSNEWLRIGQRDASDAEMDVFYDTEARSERAIENARGGQFDISCADALPNDLGDMRPTIEFMLGPFS